jgi:hypothetical protein
MIPRHLHARSLLPLLLFGLMAAPVTAAAQLTFGGMPWGTPRDSATALVQRAGYVLRGDDQDGDRVFGDAAGVDLVTKFDSTGLAGVDLEWSRPVDALPARFATLADSLRRAFGPPSQAAEGEEPAMDWERDGVRVSLFLFPRGGGRDSLLSLRYESPGWEAEFERRRVENGMMYNGAITEVELDCRRMEMRLLRTIPIYEHRALPPIDGPAWLPPMPNAHHAQAATAACEALGRQPAGTSG